MNKAFNYSIFTLNTASAIMSQLKNAPLIEVIFELRWHIENSNDLNKYQYLPGDLYSALKEDYPRRKPLVPPEIPIELNIGKVAHRFQPETEDYPLVQIGPGIITHNVIDRLYYWNEFSKSSMSIIKAFDSIFPLDRLKKVQPNLVYIDFFDVDVKSVDITNFISENFKLNVNNISDSFETIPGSLDMNLVYPHKLGNVVFKLSTGNWNKKPGLIMQTRVVGVKDINSKEELHGWLEESYSFCSVFFKEITSKELYKSFN